MSTPDILRIFVGWDSREPIGYATFCHSIITRASKPITIIPLVQQQLRNSGLYTRKRGPTESTEFSMTRFLIPRLCNYEGHAIFVDGADMLMRADIYELQQFVEDAIEHRGFAPNRFNSNVLWKKPPQAVFVAKHDYTPTTATKMDGVIQTIYGRKNWSSVIWFNCSQCTVLTPDLVNNATGLELHRFHWLGDEQIGALPLEWNWLVGQPGYPKRDDVKLIHYTDGPPFFKEYADCDYSDEWFREAEAMLHPQINAGVPS